MQQKNLEPSSAWKEHSTLYAFLFAAALLATLPLPLSEETPPSLLVPKTDAGFTVLASESSIYQQSFVAQGVLKAKRSAIISNNVDATATQVFVNEGSVVAKDDLLFILEHDSLGYELVAAKKLAEKTAIDFQALSTSSENLFTTRERLEIEANYNQAQANWIKLQEAMDNYFVRAPFAGIVEELHVIENTKPEVNKVVARISDVLTLEAELQISEQEARKLSVRDLVKVTPRKTDFHLEGVISFVSDIIDAETMTVNIKVDVANLDNLIKSGHVVTLEFLSSAVEAHHVRPYMLTTNNSGDLGVLAIDEKNVVRFYEAEFVDQDLTGVWVKGLPKKLNIIASGQNKLEPGTKVPYVEPQTTGEKPKN